MNSKYEQRLSVDELMNRQNGTAMTTKTIRAVEINEAEWEQLTEMISTLHTLIREEENERRKTEKMQTDMKISMMELTRESLREMSHRYEELVGKASGKAAFHIERRMILDDLLWGLRLAAMALPTIFVLLLSVWSGLLRL